MAAVPYASNASVSQIVDVLRDSPVSRIFWLNLCAQLREGIVDERAALGVIRQAWADYCRSASTLPQRGLALLGCIVQACRDNELALVAVTRLAALTLNEIEELRVVLDGRLLWQYYLEADADSLTSALRHVPCGRSLHDVDESAVADVVLKACWDARRLDLRERFGSLAREATLQTRVKRLWASFSEADRPEDPQRLAQRLGLSSMNEGTWVVEFVYGHDQLREALVPGDERFLLRPTAFCINDMHAPRFRGLARGEVGARQRGDTVHPVGRTVDLDGWAGSSGSWRADDGLPEIVCPALQWQGAILPSRIRLLGPLREGLSGPDNEQFAEHLEDLFLGASRSETDVIDMLAGLENA